MITLGNFCLKNNVIPDFIKIDVEKIESEVIKGGINLLKSYHPILTLEVYLNERFIEYEEVLKILKSIGYKSFFINFNGDIEEIEINKDLKNRIKYPFDNFIFSF